MGRKKTVCLFSWILRSRTKEQKGARVQWFDFGSRQGIIWRCQHGLLISRKISLKSLPETLASEWQGKKESGPNDVDEQQAIHIFQDPYGLDEWDEEGGFSEVDWKGDDTLIVSIYLVI
jgi:hypothetical protein